MGLRVAYVYEGVGTSLHRAAAIERCGHHVATFHSKIPSQQGRLAYKFNWETGGLFLGDRVSADLWKAIGKDAYDVLWVDHGRYVSRALLDPVRATGAKSVVFNHDDPFGYRDRLSWLLYKKSLKDYDLTVVVRDENVPEAQALGARDVLRVWRSADEVAHGRVDWTAEQLAPYRSDVLFLGTWMPGREEFMLGLAEREVPVTIVGGRWDRAPHHEKLGPLMKGGHTKGDEEYKKWIQGAQICLGFVSKGNRDRSTSRTFEVPSLGTLFCAERTDEHMRLYQDGVEAVFWDDVEECAARCMELLSEPERIAQIAAAGHDKVIANKTMNQDIVTQILDRLTGPPR